MQMDWQMNYLKNWLTIRKVSNYGTVQRTNQFNKRKFNFYFKTIIYRGWKNNKNKNNKWKKDISTGKELTILYVEDAILLLTDIIQLYGNAYKPVFGIKPLFFYSTCSFTWKAGLKITGVELDYVPGDKVRLSLENNPTGGSASVKGNRLVKRSDTAKLQYWNEKIYMDQTSVNTHQRENLLKLKSLKEMEINFPNQFWILKRILSMGIS